MSLLSAIWSFLRIRKKYWLLPIVVITMLLGSLMLFGPGGEVAPFIYTFF